MVIEANPQLERVAVKYLEITQDDRTRAVHEARLKHERDTQARIDAGIDAMADILLEKGHKEGREEGREDGDLEARYQMARNLLEDKMPHALVHKYTGISLEEIDGL